MAGQADATGPCAAATPSPSLAERNRPANSRKASTSTRGRGGFPTITTRVLDYCKRFGVALEPFIQLNHNAMLHSTNGFGGKPQRIREVKADFQGQVSELLAKATQQGKLDEAVSREDKEILLAGAESMGRSRCELCLQIKPDLRRFPWLCEGPGRRARSGTDAGHPACLVGHFEIPALAQPAEFRAL